MQIEKGIPMPKTRKGRPPNPLIAAMKAMEIGDSGLSAEKLSTIKACARKAGIKVVTEEKDGGFRVWRKA